MRTTLSVGVRKPDVKARRPTFTLSLPRNCARRQTGQASSVHGNRVLAFDLSSARSRSQLRKARASNRARLRTAVSHAIDCSVPMPHLHSHGARSGRSARERDRMGIAAGCRNAVSLGNSNLPARGELAEDLASAARSAVRPRRPQSGAFNAGNRSLSGQFAQL